MPRSTIELDILTVHARPFLVWRRGTGRWKPSLLWREMRRLTAAWRAELCAAVAVRNVAEGVV